MTIDIYTDARSENIPKKVLLKNPNLKQIGMQIASIVIDENENEYHFAESTSVVDVKKKWSEFDEVEFKVNSTMAEMYSIYTALIQAVWIDSPVKKINLYTDSEQSFKFINEVSKMPDGDVGFKPMKPKCKLTRNINTDIKEFISSLRESGVEVDIRWIKGHVGVYYNTKVDKLCKS
jgi:ribonuclease HI